MDLTLRGVLAAHQGLVTRPHLLDAGISLQYIRHLLETGELVWVRRGVYADGGHWRSLDEWVGRPRLRTRAAVLTMRRGWVLSHDSSAQEQELQILKPPEPHVHVTRPGYTGAWTKFGVKHHLARYLPSQVVTVDGLPALDLARTAVDIAREHGEPYGEVACDSALRLGVGKRALEEAMAPMVSWPHIRRTRRAVEFARPGADSPVETLARLLVRALGFTDADIELQFPVALGDGSVAWADIRVGCHLFEPDGRLKYVDAAAGGFATKQLTSVVWEEKKRERLLHREGLGTSRVIFEDYWPTHRAAALVRMRAEYDETVARFGSVLPEHLRRNADLLRQTRGARGA